MSAADRAALADRVHSAAIHLLRRLRKQDEASGLSAARMSALSVVVFGGPVTIGHLARAEQVRFPTMTRLVVGLESDGLVKRERDANDARVSWIRATAKGERILREGRQRRVAELARDLEQLPDEDIDQLQRGVAILERLSGRSDSSLGVTAAAPVAPPAPGGAAASPTRAARRTR
ncbi:MAG: MarR family transcriptional regulator [Gemmatimonadota bacterium]